MVKLAPRISLVIWSLWLALSILEIILNPASHLPRSPLMIALTIVDLGIKGGGVVLSFFLARQPNPGMAFLLTGLSLFAFWKFHFGGIVVYMSPQFGDLSFKAALIEWWKQSTKTFLTSLRVLPFAFFITVSLFLWPVYGLIIYSEKHKNN